MKNDKMDLEKTVLMEKKRAKIEKRKNNHN